MPSYHIPLFFSITRIRKQVYARMYPVRVINPDGSSYMIRYEEPLGVIRLPQDPNTLSDEEKKARLRRLKGERIVDHDKNFDNDDVHFDQDAVRNLVRKRKI